MPDIRLYIFDDLRLTIDGDPVPINSASLAKLLGYLALYASQGRTITRARLAQVLWPDLNQFQMQRSLVNTLYRLRQLLGDPVYNLIFQKETNKKLGLGLIWVDIHTFQKGARAAKIEQWCAALDLYVGAVLEDIDAEWLILPRAELHELYLTTIARACLALEDDGECDRALQYALMWAHVDSYNEEAHCMVMRIYARLKRHSSALQHYEQMSKLLSDELGIEPGVETRHLAHNIREEQVALANVPTLSRHLIGRQQERALLLQCVERAQQGCGGIVLLEGEAGVGKTCLLHSLAESAGWRGLRVVWGTAASPSAAPFAPLLDALHSALSGTRADQVCQRLSTASLDVLKGLLPELALNNVSLSAIELGSNGVSSAIAVIEPPKALQITYDLYAALAELLGVLAELEPHLIILDDVHRADASLWETLMHVGRNLQTQRLLIVLSYQSECVPPSSISWQGLLQLDRIAAPIRVRLDGLSLHECDLLVRNSGLTIEAKRLVELHQSTGGNTLFIQELLLARWPEHRISNSLHDLMEQRLAALSDSALVALEIAAVLGRSFLYHIWRAAVGIGLDKQLPELLGQRFLEEHEHGYCFRHNLLREHLYNRLVPARRREIHRQLARLLEQTTADAAMLAWHWGRAGSWQPAARYHRIAGASAAKIHAYSTALEHYQQALELFSGIPESEEEQLELLCERQLILGNLVNVPAWRADIVEIERLANITHSNTAMLDAWEARLKLCVLDADLTLLLQLGIQALSVAANVGNRAAEARLAGTVGKYLALRRMKQEPAMQYIQRAFDCASQIDDPALLATVLCQMAFVQRRYGQYRAARCTAQSALLLIEQHAEQLAELRANALMELACAERGLTNWPAAWSSIQIVVQLHKELCNYWGLGEAYLEFVGVACCIGQPEAARRVLDSLADVTHTLGVASEADIRMYLMFAKVVSVQYDVQIGDYESAQQQLDILWQWAATLDRAPVFTLHIVHGLLYLAQGQFTAAAAELGRALDIWDGQRPEPELLLWHAIAAQRAGRIEDAARSLERAVLVLQRCDMTHCDILLHFTCYLVFDESTALMAAHTEMMRQAAQFTDPQMYDDFLHKIPLHCAIEAHKLALVDLGKKVVVRLTGSHVPLGKSLTDVDRVDVVWTVDAGEPDAEVLRSQGKISLRHYRIKRLLIEARSQNATPTDADLARVLGVSTRTIFSDMRALGLPEQTLHTRRRQRLPLK